MQKQRQIQELVSRRGRVAEEGTRVGCVEHEEEAWSISHTNTLRALQTQTHSDHYKYKHTQIITNTNTLRSLQIQTHSEHCKCKHKWTINTNISTNRRRTRKYVS